jgi:hypothetical protein
MGHLATFSKKRLVTQTVSLQAVLFVTLLMIRGCTYQPNGSTKIGGRVLGWKTGLIQLELASGATSEFPLRETLRNPQYYCVGPKGLPIVRCQGPFDEHAFTRGVASGDSLFQFDYRNSSLTPLRAEGLPSHYVCNWMDYDSTSKRYLYLGKLDTVVGLFILDSNFNRMERLDNFFPDSFTLGDLGPVFFTPDGVIAQIGRRIVVLDSATNKLENVAEGSLKTISPSRGLVIVDSDSTLSYELVDLKDGKHRLLYNSRAPRSGCVAFDPTGQYLAYTKYEGFPETSVVYVWDLSRNLTVMRRQCVLNQFIWVP